MSLTAKYKSGLRGIVTSLRLQRIVTALLFVLSFPVFASAQTPSLIRISVADENHQPVSGATVFWDTNTQTQGFAITDNDGVALLNETETGLRRNDDKITILVKAVGFEQRVVTVTAGNAPKIILSRSVSTLDKVVVTGQFDATRPQQSAESVKVIDKATMERLQVTNVRDLLQQQPNFRITEDNILGSNLTLHGLGGNNVKVLMDGVPVIGRENGNIDLGQLPLHNVERVEIVEGPMSVLYSTDATAGVVNLITRRASEGRHRIQGSVIAESPRSLYADASAWLQFRSSHLSLSGGRHYFDGYPKFDSSRVQQWKPSLKHYAGIGYGWKTRRSTAELKGDYFSQNTLDRGAVVETPYEAYAFDTRYYTERINGAFFFNYDFGKMRLDQMAAYSTYSRSRRMFHKDLTTLDNVEVAGEGMGGRTDINHLLYRVLLQQTSFSRKLRFQGGAELNHETGSGEKIAAGTPPIIEYAALGQLEYAPVDKLLIKPGLRVNYNTVYEAPLVPSLNIRWEPDTAVQVRAGAARGYRAPSLKELYLSFVDMNHNLHGNPDLLAETSWNGNVALHVERKLSASVVSFESSVYVHDISDQIILAKTDSASLTYTYTNVEHTLAAGFAFDVDIRTRNVTLGAGMNFNGLDNSALAAATAWSPGLSALMQWDMPKPGILVTVSYKNIGVSPSYAFNENGELQRYITDGYSLLDALVAKKLFKNSVRITAGVKNILNVTNVQSALPAGVHETGNGLAVARGRYFTAGVSFNLSRNIKTSDTPTNE